MKRVILTFALMVIILYNFLRWPFSLMVGILVGINSGFVVGMLSALFTYLLIYIIHILLFTVYGKHISKVAKAHLNEVTNSRRF